MVEQLLYVILEKELQVESLTFVIMHQLVCSAEQAQGR